MLVLGVDLIRAGVKYPIVYSHRVPLLSKRPMLTKLHGEACQKAKAGGGGGGKKSTDLDRQSWQSLRVDERGSKQTSGGK